MKYFDVKVIGSRIKEIRLEREMTQKELGEKVGVRQNAISRYESGIKTPSLEILFNIAIALDTSADYILGIIDFE